jgi:hypothetical protein
MKILYRGRGSHIRSLHEMLPTLKIYFAAKFSKNEGFSGDNTNIYIIEIVYLSQ